MEITATEFKRKLGQYLDEAERGPVIINKSGREKSVLLSFDAYNRLIALEDAYWAQKAGQAEAGGYLGAEKTDELLNRTA
ncbi:type II toxin-antitoxin system Phd/YefM family antitoxin [Desulfosarcina sp. OttesenSCG-928-G10]|nr:type II toxin-antitoxin system Phd/YefM family antitoxin [Desulfosarcina sp. OttesenSCG-928-G10]